jgi:LysM repeat protein
MTSFPLRLIPGLIGLAACFTLGACKSTSSSSTGYDDVVDYTTPKTELSKEEYPFDEDGNYRVDWAAAGAGVSGVNDKPTDSTPYIQEEDTPAYTPTVASTTPRTSSSSSARKPSSSSSSRSTASRPKPKPKPKPAPKPTVVTIKKGDTLSAISRRTGVSVSAIKAYNGMSSDFIREGRSLKIPPKKR